MTATGHALIGALLAGKIHDPLSLAAVAYLSHFPCDILPHWDVGTNGKKKDKTRIFYESVADVLVSYIASFILFWFVLGQHDLFLLVVGVFAVHLPDWISYPAYLWKIHFFPSKAMLRFQEEFHNSLDKPWGIVTQGGTVFLLYVLLYKIV